MSLLRWPRWQASGPGSLGLVLWVQNTPRSGRTRINSATCRADGQSLRTSAARSRTLLQSCVGTRVLGVWGRPKRGGCRFWPHQQPPHRPGHMCVCAHMCQCAHATPARPSQTGVGDAGRCRPAASKVDLKLSPSGLGGGAGRAEPLFVTVLFSSFLGETSLWWHVWPLPSGPGPAGRTFVQWANGDCRDQAERRVSWLFCASGHYYSLVLGKLRHRNAG